MFIEHVNLSVADLDRSIAFYRDLFGFTVRWKGTLTSGMAAAHVGGERFYIALFQAQTGGRIDRDYLTVGINHFGFVVDNLDELKARLEKLGIEPTPEADYEPGRRIYFLDPDGIEIELVQYEPSVV